MAEIVLGTAALGMRYGLWRAVPGGTVDERQALAIVREAFAVGIATFDTAPAYGEAEQRLGLALGDRGRVWTKVRTPDRDSDSRAHLDASVSQSLRSLCRAKIDVLQWHNWTRDLAEDGWFRAAWEALARDNRISALGASTYGVEDAVAAVQSGLFSQVQVEWNLLNQSVVAAIGPLARARQVSIAVRSVLLQGALTNEGRALPPLPGLVHGVNQARALADGLGLTLEQLALGAALGHDDIAYVIVGMDRLAQVHDAFELLASPPLTSAARDSIRGIDMGGDPAVDPRTWRI